MDMRFRVQSSLIKNGLNIYLSFLHSSNEKKPTLVFDMIEEFRSFVVDKEIISTLNRNIKITSNKNLFIEKSKRIVLEHIQKRLVHLVNWKNGKYKIESIMQHQSKELSKSIEDSVRYRGFIQQF